MSVVLRSGYTTGTCAAAASKAAAMVLCGSTVTESVEVSLPDGTHAEFAAQIIQQSADSVEAAVRKDAGDDPDVTDKLWIHSRVEKIAGTDIVFAAGEGVGIVTKPGLSVSLGEPAINPAPRKAICEAVREITSCGLLITISIPGGRELSLKTFNPRLGIQGGLSVLGTSGIVRPFSVSAMLESLKCALDVAAASGIKNPILVPGNIGERAAKKNFHFGEGQIVQVSNQWGFMLDAAAQRPFERILVVGHPGKLAKIAEGEWDTHSSQSGSAVPGVARLVEEILQVTACESLTVEGLFASLAPEPRRKVADALSRRIRSAMQQHMGIHPRISVALINMNGDLLGADGELTPWK